MDWIKRLLSKKENTKQCVIHDASGSVSEEFNRTLMYDTILFGSALSKEDKKKYLKESEGYYKSLIRRDRIR